MSDSEDGRRADSTPAEIRAEISDLVERLRRYQYQYYVTGHPEVSDLEYDRLFDTLIDLEQRFPDARDPLSPTARVGSDLTNEFPEIEHTIPMLSLDKAYQAEDVVAWMRKTDTNVGKPLRYVAEEKIDGFSIVLYYDASRLQRAVTRGNGYIGNDVTGNVLTIRSLPLRLHRDVDVVVRGEVFLPRDEFQRINSRMEIPYANPRNLAAGTIRRKNSREVAEIPLDLFVYDGYFEPSKKSHSRSFMALKELGFKTNPRMGIFSADPIPDPPDGWVNGSLDDFPAYARSIADIRSELNYEIDGLVVKVDDTSVREGLGSTGHHPRWALALKFEAPEGQSVVRSIEVQVGRTGRITPVAKIDPVEIGGSTIRNVTLHNQEYIRLLELAIGDTVAVSKRGDVIPAIEKVLEPNTDGNTTWEMPATCPSCGETVSKTGAHSFCTNRRCPDQVRQRLYYFVGSNQMDIENLGPETIDVLISQGMVQDPADLYICDYDRLLELPGFGEKKIAAIRRGIEESKKQPYRIVLQSLGIPELGRNVAELLIRNGFPSIDSLYAVIDAEDLESLEAIPGIGQKIASNLAEELGRQETRVLIKRLRENGVNFTSDEGEDDQVLTPDLFSGQTWCVTGSFAHFKPRDRAAHIVEACGGRVTGSVSGKTTHLLAGENPGSKLDKAKDVGATIVDEDEFLQMIRELPEHLRV
jgi:DNA ligase (NAD+)